jgi:hypothetical protein
VEKKCTSPRLTQFRTRPRRTSVSMLALRAVMNCGLLFGAPSNRSEDAIPSSDRRCVCVGCVSRPFYRPGRRCADEYARTRPLREITMPISILFAVGIILWSSGTVSALAQACDMRCAQKYCAHGVTSRFACMSRCTIWCSEFQQSHCGGVCSKEQWDYWRQRNFR